MFRLWLACIFLDALAWVGTFTVDPDISNPAVAFAIFIVIGAFLIV